MSFIVHPVGIRSAIACHVEFHFSTPFVFLIRVKATGMPKFFGGP
jgi:hypothetical protein